MIYGRGIFQNKFGILPYRKPIVSVVGTPIDTILNKNPTTEEVIRVHEIYMQSLKSLFDEYKDVYDPNRKSEIRFL